MENMSELEPPLEMDSPLCNPKIQNNFQPVYPQKYLNATHTNYEEYRIRTFKSWPVQAPVQPDRLARAGFYYLGKGLEVVCFSCGGKISDWTYGDIAMQKHTGFFPNCPFVNNQSNNVPLSKRVQQEYENHNGGFSEHNSRHPAQTQSSPVPSTSVNSSEVYMMNGYHSSRETQHGFSRPHGRLNSPATQAFPKDFQVRMKYENERLKTFLGKWPLDYISPADLARCGFFYLDILDKVQCAFCGGVLTKWEPGDKPYVEHKNNFPLCPFVKGVDVGNVSRGEDICGVNVSRPNERRWMPNSGPENRVPSSIETLENIGVALHRGPQHPSQASKDARLRSFMSWPQHSPLKAEELVEAGFFYIGLADNVKCFYCDGGLSNWELGDDPWMEHARWFPGCYFVRLNKGGDFIKQSIARGESLEERRMLTGHQVSIESSPSESGEYSSSAVLSPGNEEEESAALPLEPSPLDLQVEEGMKSPLVQAFLRANAYPAHMVRHALLRKFQMTGRGVSNVDELSEAIYMISHSQHSEPSMECENQEKEQTENKNMLNGFTGSKIHPLQNSFEAKTELSLEEENRQLKEQRLCKICMDQEVGVVFVPCGHLIACVQCAPALTDCALCRTAIKGTVRTFLS